MRKIRPQSATRTRRANVNTSSLKRRSRRHFLRLAGAAVATGAVAHTVPALAHTQRAEPKPQPEEIQAALNFAVASPIFKEVVEELQRDGFRLSTDAKLLVPTVSQRFESLIGLGLHCERGITLRHQADIVLTVDMAKEMLLSLQVVKGWSWFDVLFVTGTNFDARWPLYEEIRSARVVYPDPPRLIRPRRVQSWTFDRASVRPPKDEAFLEEGWPPESDSDCFWHFDGCIDIAYIPTEYVTAFRGTVVTESNMCAANSSQKLDPVY